MMPTEPTSRRLVGGLWHWVYRLNYTSAGSGEETELSGPIQKETDFAIGFPAKTDIWCSGVTPSATSAVDASMNIALVDN